PHSPPPFLSTDRPTTQIYTLSLHDALPISLHACRAAVEEGILPGGGVAVIRAAAKVLDGVRKKVANEDQQIGVDIVRRAIEAPIDRKSTRLNSSHLGISYAVFCLKKKSAQT